MLGKLLAAKVGGTFRLDAMDAADTAVTRSRRDW